jgi:serine/threonine protein kinase
MSDQESGLDPVRPRSADKHRASLEESAKPKKPMPKKPMRKTSTENSILDSKTAPNFNSRMKKVTTVGPGVMRNARRVSAPEFHRAVVQQELTIDDFTLVHLLGQGGVGNVWYAIKQDTQQVFAMKIIDKHHIIGSSSVGRVLAEREIMTMLEHPFVITLHFAFQDDTRIFFVLDFLSGGDFFRLMKQIPDRRMSEEAAMFYAAEIMLALEYLHDNNICFRDLKPENILLSTNGHIRVTDFGLASRKSDITVDTTHKTVCGTPEYMAPEVIREEGHGRPVDYWALGVIIYEMIVGKTPWAEMSATDMFFSVLTKPVPFPKSISNSARHLIEGLMSKDPKTRMGVSGADEVKNHPFFKNIDWKEIGAEQCKPPFVPEVRNHQVEPGYKSMDEFKQHFKPYCSPKHTPIATPNSQSPRSMTPRSMTPDIGELLLDNPIVVTNANMPIQLQRKKFGQAKVQTASRDLDFLHEDTTLSPVPGKGSKGERTVTNANDDEDSYLQMAEIAPYFPSYQGMAKLDRKLTILFGCPYLDQMMGIPCAGQTPLNFVHEDDLDKLQGAFQELIQSGELQQLELRMKTADSRLLNVMVMMKLETEDSIMWCQQQLAG